MRQLRWAVRTEWAMGGRWTIGWANKAMWMRPTVATLYPQLWPKVEFLLLAFPTSYLVECGFSRVNMMLTKSRNRLDIMHRGDIRMALTKLTPNVEKLAEQHQPQGSH